MVENVNQIKSGIKISLGVSVKNPIKHSVYEKGYVKNSSVCACKINKYLKDNDYMKSFIYDSLIIHDEINDKKSTYKMDYYILHAFLLVNILLLMIVIICYYCIKHQSKQ